MVRLGAGPGIGEGHDVGRLGKPGGKHFQALPLLFNCNKTIVIEQLPSLKLLILNFAP